MKSIQYLFSLLIVFAICLYIYECENVSDPFSSINQTPYGTVTQIDDYPLYMIEYTSDYKFDQFLETGDIPFTTHSSTKYKNYNCTCFSVFGGGQRLLARNYDWSVPSSYYLVFTDPKDGYASVSTVDLYFFEYDHNQSPDFESNLNMIRTLPYFPFDGMNEKGVAVGMNAVDSADPPYDPSKVTIGELQLIRLVLDYASSTQEAISLIIKYNIRMENPRIHYLIADSTGHSVIVEFLNGKMEIIENTNTWQVTTNFVITGLDSYENAPCWRYKNACERLDDTNGQLSDGEALDLLQIVSVGSTRWSTVFNLKTGELQIAMGRKYGNLHNYTLP